MTLALLIVLTISVLLGFVVFFGPPYVPTLRRNMESALDLLNLKSGETMLDLGSGDGRVLLAAAKRGANVVGIELSPLLVIISWLRTRRYRKQVRIIWGNYFTTEWPRADAIFTFMIQRQMGELDDRIEEWRGKRAVRLASFAFPIPGKKPAATRNGVFLYEYDLRRRSGSFTMSSMKQNSQSGYVSGTLIALIVVSTVLVGALAFGGWAFLSRQDYKNNSDKKALAAADERQAATEEADALKYAEEAKNPLTVHKAPDQFGSVTIHYPKTWSGYADEAGAGNTPVDDFFHPKVVPGSSHKGAAYALRVQVVEQAYDRVVDSYRSDVENRKLAASPTSLTKVSGVIGTRFEGQLDNDKQGILIVLPMRNLTLKVWTESKDFVADFEKIILPNLTFSP